MISAKLAALLNKQVQMESAASHIYLAMASWAECAGFEGISKFFYIHSDEEREHMLKLFHYINERGGKSLVPTVEAVKHDYSSVKEIFESLLNHEIAVSLEINKLVAASLEEQDFITHNFLQWYVAEQMEEERLARAILDKANLVGDDQAGLYMFDRDCGNMADMESKK
jgi:ferritin